MEDYFQKPYLNNSESSGSGDYVAMTEIKSKMADPNYINEKDSEFEQPYLKNAYDEMQHFGMNQFKLQPFSNSHWDKKETVDVSTIAQGDAVLRINPNFPTIICGDSGTINFTAEGHDHNGKAWRTGNSIGQVGFITTIDEKGNKVTKKTEKATGEVKTYSVQWRLLNQDSISKEEGGSISGSGSFIPPSCGGCFPPTTAVVICYIPELGIYAATSVFIDHQSKPVYIEGPEYIYVGASYKLANFLNKGDDVFWNIVKAGFTIEKSGYVSAVDAGYCGLVTITAQGCGEMLAQRVLQNQPISIMITGPDQISIGAVYSASGGTAPYTWSMTQGSIDSAGVITSISGCGVAEITATDANGCRGKRKVRNPTGVWINNPPNGDPFFQCSAGYPQTPSLDCIVDTRQIRYAYVCCPDIPCNTSLEALGCTQQGPTDCGVNPCGVGTTFYILRKYGYDWVCP